MSEQMIFDRKKGFVALPVEILDLDLAPGAFRTLVELCRMANADGFCWPSLGQLSDRMGRSKAAISGYVQELRKAGLIATEEQQMANGYNYRLKYRVTFWQSWRASLAGKTAAAPERSVQPAERSFKEKNQSYKIHLEDDFQSALDRVLDGWAKCFRGAPYPSARISPSSNLLNRSERLLASAGPVAPPISADIERKLTDLWTDLRLDADPAHVAQQVEMVRKIGFTSCEFNALLSAIRKAWPDHWRRTPTPAQFEKLVKASGIIALAQKISLLESHQKRWALAEKHLRGPRPICSVNPNDLWPSSSAQTGKYPRI